MLDRGDQSIFVLQALSNVLWGLATLDHCPSEEFWVAAASSLTQLAPDCEAQHLSNAAWAFAKLQRQPSARQPTCIACFPEQVCL